MYTTGILGKILLLHATIEAARIPPPTIKIGLTQVRQNYEKSKKILLKIDGYHPLTLVGGRIPPENIL